MVTIFENLLPPPSPTSDICGHLRKKFYLLFPAGFQVFMIMENNKNSIGGIVQLSLPFCAFTNDFLDETS